MAPVDIAIIGVTADYFRRLQFLISLTSFSAWLDSILEGGTRTVLRCLGGLISTDLKIVAQVGMVVRLMIRIRI